MIKLHSNIMLMLYLPALIVGTAAMAAPKVDVSVESIISAGWWESGGERGSYRIIVWNGGYEHVSSGVTVEWLAEPKSPDDAGTVRHSSELVAPGMLRIGTPKVTRLKNGVRIDLSGVHTYEPGRKISCRFEASPDGKTKTIVPCH